MHTFYYLKVVVFCTAIIIAVCFVFKPDFQIAYYDLFIKRAVINKK